MPQNKPSLSITLCLNVNQGNKDRNAELTLYPNTTTYPNGQSTPNGSWPMSIELASGTTFVDAFSIVYPDDNRTLPGANYTVTFTLPDGYSFAAGPGTVPVPGAPQGSYNYEDGIAWLSDPGSKQQLKAKIKQGKLELTFKKAQGVDWADWRYSFAFVVEDSSGAVLASPDPDATTGSDGSTNPP